MFKVENTMCTSVGFLHLAPIVKKDYWLENDITFILASLFNF